jgi:molybdopterin biosynthesis enzyme
MVEAAPDRIVGLEVVAGLAAVGEPARPAVRILSSAGLPAGADAVVAEELTRQEGDRLLEAYRAWAGRNIRLKGDVADG